MQQTNQSKNAGNSFNFAQNPAGAAGNSMGMAAFQNQMGGQVGANLQGMAGMQQQMSAMQNMAGMQNVAGMQNLQGFQSGNASNPNPAARLQQMQVLLQQQQQPNGVNGLGNQMQFAGMQGSFGQQNQGQQQAQFSQQQMLNMLRGPQVVPQTSSVQQAVTTTTPAPNGSMPPPAVQKPGPDQKDGTQGDMTSFNW
uniref:Uncharacterized protein n=1 Tax=Entomoneis paludosa TaxID=265537 RepID=A0A7S2YD94_9STRA|mmetsp:Transcript_27982/g.58606  ORF Transcript_27982/g.58606 Transcript_27982/m.58606 type:complete len:196 (+) Transcript_27982:1-588(+)